METLATTERFGVDNGKPEAPQHSCRGASFFTRKIVHQTTERTSQSHVAVVTVLAMAVHWLRGEAAAWRLAFKATLKRQPQFLYLGAEGLQDMTRTHVDGIVRTKRGFLAKMVERFDCSGAKILRSQ